MANIGNYIHSQTIILPFPAMLLLLVFLSLPNSIFASHIDKTASPRNVKRHIKKKCTPKKKKKCTPTISLSQFLFKLISSSQSIGYN